MAMQITTVVELHDYFTGVVQRAKHHAPNVDQIIYPVLGMIIAYKDSGTEINVWEQSGSTGNLLWVQINGKRYAFRYDHPSDSIEIREETYKGKLVKTINNGTTLSNLFSIFEKL